MNQRTAGKRRRIRRRAVVVLGMHRSGTSLLAALLCTAGLSAPRNPLAADAHNETGYWEPVEVQQLNDAILSDLGMDWRTHRDTPWQSFHAAETLSYRKRIRDVIGTAFDDSGVLCLKDPRLCRLLPLWIPALEDAGIAPAFVITTRNPLEVADSALLRDQLHAHETFMLWLQHTLDAERHTRTMPRVFVTYDQILSEWRCVLQRIGQRLAITWPSRLTEIEGAFEQIISDRLRHHRALPGELEARNDIPSWLSSAHRVFKDAAEGRDERLQGILNGIRREVSNANKAFEPLLIAERLDADDRRDHARNLEGEVQLRDSQIAILQGQISEREHELAISNGMVTELGAKMHAHDEEINQLTARLRREADQLNESRSAVAERDAQLSATREELVKVKRRLRCESDLLRESQAAVAQRDATIDSTKRRLAKVMAHLRTATEQLSQSHAALAERDAEIAAREERVARAMAQLRQQRRLLHEGRVTLAERTATIQAANEKISELTAKLQAEANLLHESRAALAERDAQIRASNEQLARMADQVQRETQLRQSEIAERDALIRINSEELAGLEARLHREADLLRESRSAALVAEVHAAALAARYAQLTAQLALSRVESAQSDALRAMQHHLYDPRWGQFVPKDADRLLPEERTSHTREVGTSLNVELDAARAAARFYSALANILQQRNSALRMQRDEHGRGLAGRSSEHSLNGSASRSAGSPAINALRVPPDTCDRGHEMAPIKLREWRIDIDGARSDHALRSPIGVFVHIYYVDLADELASVVRNIGFDHRVYVSTDSEEKRVIVAEAFSRADVHGVVIKVLPNTGLDLGPLLFGFADEIRNHEICLRLHGKKSIHLEGDLGTQWRRFLLSELAGDTNRVDRVVSAFLSAPDLGMLIPRYWPNSAQWVRIGANWEWFNALLAKIGVSATIDGELDFPAGSMFWFRSAALEPLLRIKWKPSDFFYSSAAPRDSTLAHAIERVFLFSSVSARLKWAFLPRREDLQANPRVTSLPDDATRPVDDGSPQSADFIEYLAPLADSGVHYDPLGDRLGARLHDAGKLFCSAPPDKARIAGGPKISVLTPVYKVPLEYLRRAVASVRQQTYENWELCISDDGSNDDAIAAYLLRISQEDERIKIHIAAENLGISAATNQALSMATGEFVGLLDNDDMLTYDALDAVAAEVARHPDTDFLYSDEFKIDACDRAIEYFPKPDWSPVSMLNCHYVGHFSVYRRSFVERLGGMRPAYDFSQDYDLGLRMSEATDRIRHIARPLYGWRMITGSGAQGDKPYARNTNIAALQDAARRRQIDAIAVALPMANHLRIDSHVGEKKVSLIIPSDNPRNIRESLTSIEANTFYKAYEILVVTRSSVIEAFVAEEISDRVRFISFDKPFNFSEKCNVGAAHANGDVLVFYNDDVRVVSQDWIERILECLSYGNVGIVGPKLVYENYLIQHAGMITGCRGLVGTAFHCLPHETNAHFGAAQWVREVSLICGACLAIPRDVFLAAGGFDHTNTPISHSDVDLCFKVRALGYSCVYTPHATLVHIGHASIGQAEVLTELGSTPIAKDKSDIYLLRRWPVEVGYDPYFPPAMRDILYHDSPESWQLYGNVPPFNDNGNMDVLLLSHDLSSSGAPRVVYEMARAFREAGHFVVVASPEDGPFRERLNDIGVPVIVDALLLRQHPTFERFAKNFDVVIANTVVTWPAVKQLHEVVNVYWYIHEISLLRHLIDNEPELCITFEICKGLWAGSSHAAEILRPFRQDVKVLEYGAEPSKAAALSEPRQGAKPIRITVFGSYEPRKGQDLALLALGALQPQYREPLNVVFFGRVLDHGFYAGLQPISTQMQAASLRGELSYEEYLAEIAASDIVLIPSRDDTLPMVSLDALAAGKILLCTSSTGTSNYIEDGKSGFIAASAAPDDIADALCRAIDNVAHWGRIGEEAKQVFDLHFSKATFARRLLDSCDALYAEEPLSRSA